MGAAAGVGGGVEELALEALELVVDPVAVEVGAQRALDGVEELAHDGEPRDGARAGAERGGAREERHLVGLRPRLQRRGRRALPRRVGELPGLPLAVALPRRRRRRRHRCGGEGYEGGGERGFGAVAGLGFREFGGSPLLGPRVWGLVGGFGVDVEGVGVGALGGHVSRYLVRVCVGSRLEGREEEEDGRVVVKETERAEGRESNYAVLTGSYPQILSTIVYL